MFRPRVVTATEDYLVVTSPHSALPSASVQGSDEKSSAGPSASPSNYLSTLCLQPPTKEQLLSLRAVPLGVASSAGSRLPRGAKRSQKARLAKDGAVHSRFFDASGSRPQPNNGLSALQSVQVEMEFALPSFITSSVTGGVQTYGSRAFTLTDFTGYGSLTSVFDQYRFDQIELWFECITPGLTTAYPLLGTAIDLDDATTPVSGTSVQDRVGALVGVGPAGHYHKWKPHMAVAAYSGAFTSYSNLTATWIDSGSPSVQHYGVKAFTYSNGVVVTFSLTVRAVISFRAPTNN